MKRILILLKNWILYSQRVLADLGIIKNNDSVRAYYKICEQNGMLNNIKFAWFGDSGSKYRTSGIYTYFTKLYSLFSTNDAVQATELNQPYLSGNIAPNERWGMLNPNGASRFVTHPTITFAATDPWSVTFVANWNGTSIPYAVLCGENLQPSWIGFRNNGVNSIFLRNSAGILYTIYSSVAYVGKSIVFTIVADGAGNLKLYVKGQLLTSISAVTSFVFDHFLTKNQVDRYFNGKQFAHIIRSGALTAAQVLAEATFFRSIYPEIQTVQIGTQEWATSNLDVVCTTQGNVVNEITNNANVEMFVNGDFEVNLNGLYPHLGGTLTRELGTRTNGAGSYVLRVTGSGVDNGVRTLNNILVIGYYYKVTGWTRSDGIGIPKVWVGGGNIPHWIGTTSTSWQQFTIYIKANGLIPYLTNGSSSASYVEWDDISFQLVGWSGLTEVYDYTVANTAGSAAVKDKAGCLAAAAWCHYNNDSANGAIYGKLYNWYAARTLQYDIDAYNAANPSTPWGYRVPTQTDFITLQTTLGGSAVAGGKMKKEGLNYWTTPNTGADNSSGYTAIGGGWRSESGSFGNINLVSTYNYVEFPIGCPNFLRNSTIGMQTIVGQLSVNKMAGQSIRLIKS